MFAKNVITVASPEKEWHLIRTNRAKVDIKDL